MLMRHLLSVAALTLTACSPSPAPEASGPANDPAAIHARILTLDTHLDTPVHFDRPGWSSADRHTFATDLTHVDLPRMREGGLDGGFFVVYTPQGALTAAGYAAAAAQAGRRLSAIERVLREQAGAMTRATRADDAARIAATGRRAAFISVENSYPLGDSIASMTAGLTDWQARGVRMAGPVHSRDNQFADSATGNNRVGGLSQLGRRWVEQMNRLGMVIDGSHSSDTALRQMMALSSVPVVLTHSGFKAIFDHPRNIDDALAREVAADGGVIQVNSVFLSRFNNSAARAPLYDRFDRIDTLSPAEQRQLAADWAALDRSERVNEGDFALFMRALLHCLDVVGVNHCGLGADWDGGGGVRGMEDVTALPRITAALLNAGYSEADVAKIWSGNVLRVLRAAEVHAASLR
jgi:membrane dipeptidase